MAELAITKSVGSLKKLFNKVKEIYFFKTPNQTPASLATADMELPVVSDGVTYNSGAADVTKVKLTTGALWTSMAEAGDADISYQIATFASDIVETFLNKVGDASNPAATISGNSYEGQGYNLQPKKVTCGLLMCSEDKEVLIFMPNVEVYSTVVVEQGKPGYINCTCSPLEDTAGAAIYFLSKKTDE